MPIPLVWSMGQLGQMQFMRAAGHKWSDISIAVGFSVSTCRQKARSIGCFEIPRPIAVEKLPEINHADAWICPPGHPVSWGAITAGTILAGEPYPLPVFAD